MFGEKFDKDDEIEESNNKVLQTAFAVERLNKAREAHMSVENIFVPAMNFDGNEKMLKEIESFVFEWNAGNGILFDRANFAAERWIS